MFRQVLGDLSTADDAAPRRQSFQTPVHRQDDRTTICGRMGGDKFGRKPLFLADIILFTAASAFQFFVDGPAQLFWIRLAMGIAIGAEYSVGWPESPRWLWNVGRHDEARGIAHKYLQNASDMEDVEHEDNVKGRFSMLF